MKRVWILAVAVLAVSAGALRAESSDDIVALAQRNVSEEVMMAAVANAKTSFDVKAEDIIKLKDAKVPDKVIAAMLKHRPASQDARPRVATPTPLAPTAPSAPAAPPVRTVAEGEGTLTLENLDDNTWSYRFEPQTSTIWISTQSRDGQGNLSPHGGINLRMPAGTFSVKYNGRDSGQSVTIFGGEKSLLMLSRVETGESDSLYVSVFEKGERKGGGRLAVLRENRGNNQAQADTAPRAEERVEVAPRREVQERVVVQSPPNTVIYREYAPAPVIVSPPVYYYSGPRYYYGGPYRYGHGYYGGNSVNFGYSRYRGRSGFSIGGGFGF